MTRETIRGRRPGEVLGRLALHAATTVTLAYIVLPLVLVVWLSFMADEIMTVPPEGYSLRWYAVAWGQAQLRDGFLTSLWVALAATALGLLITVPASFALARARFIGREALLQLLMSPLIVPGIVIGASIYVFLVQAEIATGLPLSGSSWGLVVAHLLLTVPWCVRLVTANLVGVNRSVEEAALSLGASPLVTALTVTLPMIWPGLVAAAVFGFVVSFGNIEVSLFLVAPGQITLPIAILQYLQWKIDPTIAAVSVVQIALIGLALVATSRITNLGKVV
ncbi:ABC transporter permease [Methylobacterium terricola]|uniref:ABC transporter permease n=1 Tax=Methylobacterium terricola TaxID=2583531 RepID=A0A5C4L8R2_9HYPH|nr:ABC transporter permease [Methylobacterium terricola]TNC06699.1 ABC transporter permease [Methylobacterium terricola]